MSALRGLFYDNDFKLSAGYRSDLPVFDPKDPIDAALLEKRKRLEFDLKRVEIAQILTVFLYDDYVSEAERAQGTEATRQAYKSDFNRFKSFCIEQDQPYLPTSPEALAWFVVSAAHDTKPERLQRVVSAVRFYHEQADAPWRDDLIVRAALRWARRCYEYAATEKAEAQAASPVVENIEPTINGSGQQH